MSQYDNEALEHGLNEAGKPASPSRRTAPRAKKRKDKNYFGPREERAVVFYTDPQTPPGAKERIFTKELYEPLTILNKKVVERYHKFVGVCGVEELIQRSFVYLYTQLDKFGPWRFKAFSYYGTIVHNFCNTHSERAYKEERRYSPLENAEALERDSRYSYNNDGPVKRISYSAVKEDIIRKIKQDIASNKNIRPNEIRVGNALITIFENIQHVQIDSEEKVTNFYIRKKITQIVKEITSLGTKEVSAALRSFKSIYEVITKQHKKRLIDSDEDEEEYQPENNSEYEDGNIWNKDSYGKYVFDQDDYHQQYRERPEEPLY